LNIDSDQIHAFDKRTGGALRFSRNHRLATAGSQGA
jgi:hypothetical protein